MVLSSRQSLLDERPDHLTSSNLAKHSPVLATACLQTNTRTTAEPCLRNHGTMTSCLHEVMAIFPPPPPSSTGHRKFIITTFLHPGILVLLLILVLCGCYTPAQSTTSFRILSNKINFLYYFLGILQNKNISLQQWM